MICRSQNLDSNNFERILRFVILFYLPIFIKYHFITQFTNQTAFTFSGLFVLGFSYLWFIYDFVKDKCDQFNNKVKMYENLKEKNEEFCKNYESLKIDET